jgi:hypothetical protein
MIEKEATYAEAQNQTSLSRSEKIRSEFKQWNRDRFRFRGTTLGLGLLTTLAWYWWTPISGWTGVETALAVGAGLSVVPQWLGDINARWVERNMKANKAFKFIGRVDRKIGQLAN